MHTRKIIDRLHHVLEAIDAAERLTADLTVESYRSDPDKAAAVERYVERLSEASRHIPLDMREKYSDIDWRGVADIGNVLRHTYDQINDQRMLDTIRLDLPPLKAAVRAMLDEIEAS